MKNIAHAFSEALRKTFNPTPEEKAEQAKKRRISMNRDRLALAARGYKLDDSHVQATYVVSTASILGYAAQMPFVYTPLNAKERERAIEEISQALLDDGESQDAIRAIIRKANTPEDEQKPFYPISF